MNERDTARASVSLPARAFEDLLSPFVGYYNDITNDNLKLIKSLKDEVCEMKKKAVANQKLMRDISLENQRLKEPLTAAVQGHKRPLLQTK